MGDSIGGGEEGKNAFSEEEIHPLTYI